MLPAGFHVNSNELRPIPGPELTGSGWICRGQRVALLLLVLLVVVVVSGVTSRFPRQFRGVPANSAPELTGSGWICRGQRVVLLWLVLLLLVVVVVWLVAWSGVACPFPRQFLRVPAHSGPRADRIWLDLSGAAG